MKIDFSSTPELTLPEGIYEGEIVTAEFKYSKAGSPMFQLGWSVGEKSFKLSSWAVLEGKALVFSKNLFKALGFDVSGELEVSPEDLIGSKCMVRIKNEKYEGEDQSRITKYIPLESSPVVDQLDNEVVFMSDMEDEEEVPAPLADNLFESESEEDTPIFASPVAQELAEKNGLDENDFIGEVPNNKIGVSDVRSKIN
jgi:pyruvate/2-oxoglutarate dehydrogenase complex dihydrolipoamide acyltransferase (E2) component